MNQDLQKLQAYPFERLAALKSGVTPAELSSVMLSIGEPKHAPPQFVLNELINKIDHISYYPKTKGLEVLRGSIAKWLERRFDLAQGSINPEYHVLPLNGTREGLFSFIQASTFRTPGAKILMPNPFYQIYEGAAFMAGATPHFLNCTKETNYIPDFDKVSENDWKSCQILILCSPGNPTGAVIQEETLHKLIALADQHDFIIASDECYSEIYFDEDKPPVGLLEACKTLGRNDYSRCVAFHSLSKRSNLPGLRSGFIAGDKDILKGFLQYRTYHGCAMPEPNQLASAVAWNDEEHVIANRALYKRKFLQVLEELDNCLDVQLPEAAFYLWPRLPVDDEVFAQKLFQETNITALPGKYLSREADGINPGANHIRLALVATEEECIEAARRIKNFVKKHY